MAWFSRGADTFRKLHVKERVSKLPGRLLTAVMMSQVASLRVLYLDVAPEGLSGADSAVLAALTGLEQLELSVYDRPRPCRANVLG